MPLPVQPAEQQQQQQQQQQTIPAYISPFNYYGNFTPGQQIILPSASQLEKLPSGQGYGCFVAPTMPVGYPLFTWTSDLNKTSINPAALCSPGFLCAYLDPSNPDTVPVVCPASVDCEINRLGFTLCPPQGRYEPVPCPAGYYCPDYKTINVCPEGNFCLTGTSTPRKCQYLSNCPPGSITETHYGTLVVVIILDYLLVIFLILHRIRELNRAKEPITNLLPPFLRKYFSRKRRASVDLSNDKGKPAFSLEDQTKLLVDAFERSFGGVKHPEMNFEFSSLSLALPSGKTVLQGVTGDVKAGRMTAIMGPSGAGKTTFMNVLMGKAKRTGGELRINGSVAEMETFRKIIGYVPQEDIMLRELTVKEIIAYAARIRLPSTWSNADVDKHADNIIKALNMTHVAHTQIGDELTRGVSGGQRKRVNIGMELAACPLAIFLDEPTSGLDSTSALDVSNILKAIARLGLTIVAVIHQPRIEIFDAFDDVLMIAPGGRTAYIGPVNLAQGYFESLGFWFDPASNKADVLMDILAGRGVSTPGRSPKSPTAHVITVEDASTDRVSAHPVMTSEEIVTAWTTSGVEYVKNQKNHQPHTPPTLDELKKMLNNRGAGFMTQMIASHNRSAIQQVRHFGAFGMEVAVGGLAGLIMGTASGGGEGFMGILVAPYTLISAAPKEWFLGMYGMLTGISIALASAPSGVKVFGEERTVYFREAASGHSKPAYYLGKSISVLYRIGLSSLHFTAIYYVLSTPNIPVGLQFILFLLNFYCIYGISVVVSMLVRRENASLMAVIVGLFSGVFCGFGPILSGSTYTFFALSPNRWAADTQYALWISDYQGIFDLDQAVSAFGYAMGNTTKNLLVMLLLGTVYRFIGFLLMVLLNRDKQR